MTATDSCAGLEIVVDDLSSAATRSLLAYHRQQMQLHSPPGSVYALDLSGLQMPEVTVWSARDGDRLLGVGALKMLTRDHAEVKSMRTHPDHLRRGVAAAFLDHVLVVARQRGLTRLSLETGSGPAFEPALALYRRRGFINGSAFADYTTSAFNQFLHLALDRTGTIR